MAKVIVQYNGESAEYSVETPLHTAGKLMISDLVLTPEQGSGEGDIQPTAKYVQPGTNSKAVTPDTGYDGLSQVDVAAVTNNLSSMAANVKSGTTLKVGVGAIGSLVADDDAIASVAGTMPVRPLLHTIWIRGISLMKTGYLCSRTLLTEAIIRQLEL